MTRNGDYDLSSPNASKRKRSDFNNRIKLINEDKPDVYISLHMNYLNDSSYYGSQVFYNDENRNNEILAQKIQDKLNKYFAYDKEYRHIDNDKYMFRRINITGVLIEYGFLSNYRDRANLKKDSYRQELSNVIIEGLLDYFT